MDLHLPTLFVSLLMLSVTLTAVVGTLAWRRPVDGATQFTAGLALFALTYGAVGLRGRVEDEMLLAAANVTAVAAFAMVNEALFRFHRQRPPRALLWATAGLALLAQPWIHGRATERVAVVSALVAVQCSIALWLLLRRRHATVGLGQYLLGANFLLILAMLAWRAFAVVSAAAAGRAQSILPQVQGASFLAAEITLVVMVLAYVIMTKEAADERNRLLAMRDELTGLGNRRTLLETLDQQAAQARRSELPLTLLMIDIDRFKSINDGFGHPSGDIAIRGVADAMRSTLRGQDVLGRCGGEEFMVILPATTRDGGVVIAERLRRCVESTRFEAVDGRPIPITISVGLHEFDPHSESRIEDVIRVADAALYAAKAQGRNRVVAA